MSVTVDSIFNTTQASVNKAEGDLNSAVSGYNANDPGSLIKMQKAMMTWTNTTQLQSQVLKVVADAIKNVVQNIH